MSRAGRTPSMIFTQAPSALGSEPAQRLWDHPFDSPREQHPRPPIGRDHGSAHSASRDQNRLATPTRRTRGCVDHGGEHGAAPHELQAYSACVEAAKEVFGWVAPDLR
jgi:hypothetical protein